jgi:hypothetical protein
VSNNSLPAIIDPYAARPGEKYDLSRYSGEQVTDIETKLGRRGLALLGLIDTIFEIVSKPGLTIEAVEAGQVCKICTKAHEGCTWPGCFRHATYVETAGRADVMQFCSEHAGNRRRSGDHGSISPMGCMPKGTPKAGSR